MSYCILVDGKGDHVASIYCDRVPMAGEQISIGRDALEKDVDGSFEVVCVRFNYNRRTNASDGGYVSDGGSHLIVRPL